MKDYKNSKELTKDYKKALRKHKNPFHNYTLNLLSNPINLVSAYRQKPYLALGNNRGDWLYIWKNQVLQIESAWVRQEDLIEKLGKLLEQENIQKK